MPFRGGLLGKKSTPSSADRKSPVSLETFKQRLGSHLWGVVSDVQASPLIGLAER